MRIRIRYTIKRYRRPILDISRIIDLGLCLILLGIHVLLFYVVGCVHLRSRFVLGSRLLFGIAYQSSCFVDQ